jgi:hypothetical protein
MEKLSDEHLNVFIGMAETHNENYLFDEVLSSLLELKQLRAEKAAYLLLAEANLKKDGK